ncbi:MFS general substrate transporter [Neoconidiobolus thromboides FSU 785]|nr:MFS general substrate transporter [Neoconidiobolus thromboides FSU 785]
MEQTTIDTIYRTSTVNSLDSKLKTEEVKAIASKETFAPEPDSLYGWLVVLASFLMQACSFGIANAFGVYIEHYSNTVFPKSEKAYISLIGTVAPTTLAISSIITGNLCDRYGFRICTLIGGAIIAVSHVLASFSTEIWHLIITQGFIFGVGGALIYVPANSVVIQWFEKRRGVAVGFGTAGSGVGGLIFALLNEYLLSTVGYAWTLRYNAIIYFVLLVFSALVVKPRIPFNLEKQTQEKTSLKPLVNLKFILFMFAMMFASFGYLVPLYYIPNYTTDMGHTKQQGATLLAIINGMSAVGRVFLGVISDHLGHLNVFIGCLGASTAFLLIWNFASSYTTLLVFAVLFGLPNGGFAGGFTTACAELFGTQNLATILGIAYAPTGLGDLAGPSLAGLIFDKSRNYNYLIYYSIGMSGMSFLLFCIIRVLSLKKREGISMDVFN